MRKKLIFKRYKTTKAIRICMYCNNYKIITLFPKQKGRQCKKCKNYRDMKRYYEECSAYLYIIKLDGEPVRVGSTNNIRVRINKYNNNSMGSFINICKRHGIELGGKKVEVWVCDLANQGVNIRKKEKEKNEKTGKVKILEDDLIVYEYRLIRMFKEKGQAILNDVDETKLKLGEERYIDEIPLEGFKFELKDHIKIRTK